MRFDRDQSRAALANALRKLGRRLVSAGDAVYLSPIERTARQWIARDGDHTLRLDYPLGPGSVVVDVGGYRGLWASDISARYRSRVFVFEPMPEFVACLTEQFRQNPDIHIVPVGLAGSSRTVDLSLEEDGSSAFRTAAASVPVQFEEASTQLSTLGIDSVDLMKVNIEGGEYELLEHLLDTGWAERITHLQVQFHGFVPDAARRRSAIRARLAASHDCRWDYPGIWESWSRKPRG